jgi:hypothetical protein
LVGTLSIGGILPADERTLCGEIVQAVAVRAV